MAATPTFTLQKSEDCRDCHGRLTGRRMYCIVSSEGKEWEMWSEGDGMPWEACRLVRRNGRIARYWPNIDAPSATDAVAFAKECHALHTMHPGNPWPMPAAAESAAPAAPVAEVPAAAPTVQVADDATVPFDPELTIAVRIPINDQFLRDVLCTAAEGGSNYWARFKCRETVDASWGGKEWKRARVQEIDENTGKAVSVHDVGMAELRKGIRVMLERGQCANQYKSVLLAAILDDDAGNVDAELADLVLQATCFDGECRYG